MVLIRSSRSDNYFWTGERRSYQSWMSETICEAICGDCLPLPLTQFFLSDAGFGPQTPQPDGEFLAETPHRPVAGRALSFRATALRSGRFGWRWQLRSAVGAPGCLAGGRSSAASLRTGRICCRNSSRRHLPFGSGSSRPDFVLAAITCNSNQTSILFGAIPSGPSAGRRVPEFHTHPNVVCRVGRQNQDLLPTAIR